MRLYKQHHRTIAASAYSSHVGDIKAATKVFTARLAEMGLKCPHDPRKFVLRWGRTWKLLASVAGRGSNSGRRRKLTDSQLAEVLDVIVNWRRDGRTGPYRSMKELKQYSQLVRDILAAAKCSATTLRRSIKRFCPELVYKNLWVKQKLTEKHKYDRFIECCGKVAENDSVREKVVWIDAKTMHMSITNRKGWVLLGSEDTFETNHPASKKKPIVLKYYAAVNHRLGKVGLTFYTGTTGMKADRDPNRPYLVS